MAGYFDKGWVCNIPKDKFYVYALFDLNGFPFYIGKGKNQRVNNHVKPCLLKEHSHKNHKISKILEEQGYVHREILMFCDSEESAYESEEFLISSYGLRNDGGCLTNVLKSRTEISQKTRDKHKDSAKKTRQARVSDAEILEAYNLYKNYFVTIESLALKLGVSGTYLGAVFSGKKRKDLMLEARDQRPITVKVTSEKAFMVVQDRLKGLTYREIMSKYSLPKTTVSRICNGVGVYASLWTAGLGNGTAKEVSTRDNSVQNLEGAA